jgi:acetyl-CoA C-acetyltransferase
MLNQVSISDLIFEAAYGALQDANLDRKEIDMIYVANYASTDFNDLNLIGPYVASILGIPNTPSIHVEDACSSGAVAIQQAALMVGAGVYKNALVLGVEKMNTKDPGETMEIIAKGGDPEFGKSLNLSAPSIYALYATRHMHEYGTTKEHLAHVAAKNYTNGFNNPKAHKQKKIDVKRVMKAPLITSPLGLHDVSLVTDGASAVVITPQDEAKNFTQRPVNILGFGMGAEDNNVANKESYTSLGSTVRAAKTAYERAGIDGKQVDMAEVHDCFTITEILDIEDLGFIPKGEGGPAVADGKTAVDGEIPVNMSGGLKAKGHPIGATGVAQVYELITQMRGEAGERQVKKSNIGVTHTLGGSPGIAAVNVYEKAF